uniref:Uncharacterized protein n=1 Tax=Leersia perrieri TaxID=77586 RepID=A0A0D9VY04_9ORYZ
MAVPETGSSRSRPLYRKPTSPTTFHRNGPLESFCACTALVDLPGVPLAFLGLPRLGTAPVSSAGVSSPRRLPAPSRRSPSPPPAAAPASCCFRGRRSVPSPPDSSRPSQSPLPSAPSSSTPRVPRPRGLDSRLLASSTARLLATCVDLHPAGSGKIMRDPFNTPVDFNNEDHHAGNELTRTNVTLSVRDHGLQNGDAKPLAVNNDTLVRHQRQGASLHNDLTAEDSITRLMDPETKELYLRSRSQEEEILLLRKQITDASLKELQLLSEKHILERKLFDLRMAVDEKQEDAISGALKQLSLKKSHLEENMRLANDLKGEEEELYFFTSSLLSMLAEFNVRPPQINASAITTGTKRLYQQMQWKFKYLNDSLGEITQPGHIYNNSNHQQATPMRHEPSSSYNMDATRSNFHRYAQDPNDRNTGQMYHGSNFHQDIVAATPSNYFEENNGPREVRLDDSQFYRQDNQENSADDDPLPGIEGFQIVGEPRPGSILTACGFPTNGTTLCNFQWVRYLENGTRQSIEGATMYDYVVSADDVGTLLAVDCTPMDDNTRQGDLVTEFANGGSKISCDPDMQNNIDMCISNGRAQFTVHVLIYPSDEWDIAILTLKKAGYHIKVKDEVLIEEKYSSSLQAKIPNGRNTQFVLVSSGGVNIPFNTQGISEPNNEDSDVRLRDLIVLVLRTFQYKTQMEV